MSHARCNVLTFSIIVLLTLSFCRSSTFAQTISLSGKILDASTGAPVPFATIFLASTTYGVSASETGDYLIQNIPKGKYDVIASCVGYENAFQSIEFGEAPIQATLLLKPKAVQLNEVVVDGTQNRKHFNQFVKLFLGTTPNSKHCEIENPEAVFLRYDQEKRILTAETTEPLVIVNRALGYRLHYLLDEFTLDERAGSFRVFGIPRFEDLAPRSDRELRKWQRARNEAYFGSMNHLMRSLVKRELRKNNFVLQSADKHVPLNADTLFKKDNPYILNFSGRLEVVYEGEKEDRQFRLIVTPPGVSAVPRPVQTSILKLSAPSLLLYDNGYFEDPKSVLLDGYLAWSESIAEMVPLGYEPIEK